MTARRKGEPKIGIIFLVEVERLLKLLREPGDLVTGIRDDFQEGTGLPGDLFTRIVARATSTAATWQTLSGTD